MLAGITLILSACAVGILLLVVRRLLLGTNDPRSALDRATMIRALTRLGELASVDGHTITLIVVGGAALVLHYQARLSTRDVDAFFVTPPEGQATRAWATIVARELQLPPDWLNDGAKGFMQGISYGPLLIAAPGILVYQVGPEQLLAMKLSAWRSQQDIDDATTVLADLVGQHHDKQALWHMVAPYTTALKAQYAFDELWERLYGTE